MSDGSYNIWSDAGYPHKSRAGGAGWLIINPRGSKTESRLTLPGLDGKYSAHAHDIAQMSAAAYALHQVYANASHANVTLHMDCKNVVRWLTRRHIPNKDKIDAPPLFVQFGHAMSLMTSMNVRIVKVGHMDENLQSVVRLAQAACSP